MHLQILCKAPKQTAAETAAPPVRHSKWFPTPSLRQAGLCRRTGEWSGRDPEALPLTNPPIFLGGPSVLGLCELVQLGIRIVECVKFFVCAPHASWWWCHWQHSWWPKIFHNVAFATLGGWITETATSGLCILCNTVRSRQPVLVLCSARPGQFHVTLYQWPNAAILLLLLLALSSRRRCWDPEGHRS